jgi:flagellar motility protein MotE (MotC chaperone)
MLLSLLKFGLLIGYGVLSMQPHFTDAPKKLASFSGTFAPEKAFAQDAQGDAEGEQLAAADPAPAAEESKLSGEGNTGKPEKHDPLNVLDAKKMQERSDELDRREAQLKRLEKEIDRKLAGLQELESRLDRMLAEADAKKKKKLKHLVEVYANMKSKQAAQVLETLDRGIAVKILAGMRGRQAGEILTYVKPDKAAQLSEALTKMQVPFE